METFLSLLLVVILVVLIIVNKKKEDFNLQCGVKRGFSRVLKPHPNCVSDKNCFPGSYFRSELYENMCEPIYGGLMREKVSLRGHCLRTL